MKKYIKYVVGILLAISAVILGFSNIKNKKKYIKPLNRQFLV